MITYPYQKFLYYLITKKLSFTDITARFSGWGIVPPSEADISEARDHIMDLVKIKTFNDFICGVKKTIDPKTFLTCISKIGINNLWLMDSNQKDKQHVRDMATAIELFDDPKYRKAINCFILCKMNDESIRTALIARYNYTVTVGAISSYKEVFWDTSIMTRVSWKTFLTACSIDSQHLYLTAMNEDESRVRYELGFDTKVKYLKALDDVVATSYFRFKQLTKHGINENTDKNARFWIKTLMDAGDRREKLESGDMEDFGKSLQMQFTFTNDEFPSYADIVGGSPNARK